MLNKPLADGGMKASNTATAAMQWAAQLNASNGQVTPLLFGNAENSGGVTIASSTAQAQGVTYNTNQYMKNNNAATIAAYFGRNGVQPKVSQSNMRYVGEFSLTASVDEVLGNIAAKNIGTKINLARAKGDLAALNQYNVDDNAPIQTTLKQAFVGENSISIGQDLANSNTLSAYAKAYGAGFYDVIAPEVLVNQRLGCWAVLF